MPNRAPIAPCALLLMAVGSQTAGAQAQEPQPLARLELLLTTAPSLSEAARVSMMTEAEAIWRAQGVAIDWFPATALRPASPHRLRVLVTERRQPDARKGDAFTVGELVRPSNGRPVAVMSIDSAQRLTASVRGRAGYDLVAVDQRRLGLVLGRALAHEIGHYLLETATHARDGLMRPRFNALEFTDLRDRTFALDRLASEWLRSRLDLQAAARVTADQRRFAYGQ
ncbi:MAG TPA: hypothetical protein VJM31_13270 [Vicinamibacterales bacterium]|nr:hypothetical protein [Vicinamibacterales bacterium]